ncbi:ECT2-like protein [Mya arenaria]|uniref:ECT2-like protein n=1 Tax=Mya arenaria TaxID=6604 RepID=A0ABY7G647_MYAAR|nr:ECT2-like protein [Mya arenaria]
MDIVYSCPKRRKIRKILGRVPCVSLGNLTMEMEGIAEEDEMKYKVPPFHKKCLSFLGFTHDEQNHMEEITIENVVLGMYTDGGEGGRKTLHISEGEPIQNLFTPSTNMSGSKSRKRKRLKENIAHLASDEELESPLYNKRRSSGLDGVISPNSFLDASNTPDISDINLNEKEQVKVTPRLQVVKEFLQTEKNYVGILHTLLNTFKAQIETQEQYNGAILLSQDIKLIFGNIPPIYNIHCSIRDELADMVDTWHEEKLVGKAEALVKAYPPFVNFFEDTKERIKHCDKTQPRFHAFLKVCQTKPECGRQTLTELLIRPVQRLPSITLLLNGAYQRGQAADREPGGNASLLSSHRNFLSRVDICKRRTKVLHSKSPAASKTPQKGYKHLEFLPLQCVRKVLDILETDECKDAFGLIVKNTEDMKEKLYSFMMDSEDVTKSSMVSSVAKSIANTLCRTDYENLISTVEGNQFSVSTQDLSGQTLSKAASRFSRRVSRAFSFNKTPRRIKRAVSHVFSPFVKDNPREFTPGNLKGKRLASSIDLTNDDNISLSGIYDDDTVSLGAFSMKGSYD